MYVCACKRTGLTTGSDLADYCCPRLIIRQQQQNEPESAWMAEIMTTEFIAVSQASEARLSFTSAMLCSGDVLWHCVLVRF